MKITMQQCIEALQGFNKLSESSLPFRQTFVVAKNIKALESVVSTFEESRNKYVTKLQGESYKDEEGKAVVPDEAAESFKTEVKALLNKSVDVEVEKISMSENEFPDVKASDIKGCIDFIKVV